MSATDILRQQGVDFRVIAKFDEKQKENAKRGSLVAGGAGGLAAAGTGASLFSAGRTGAKNARYDIKNVRADRPANAGLRLKAAGRVVRNAGKLKRTGVLLAGAGALGAGAAGHKLHQEYAGKTLAKLPRHPVEKSKYLNPKHAEQVVRTTLRPDGMGGEVSHYLRTGRAKNAFYDPKHTREGRHAKFGDGGDANTATETSFKSTHRGRLRPAGWATLGGAGATAGGTAIGYQKGKKSKVAKGYTAGQMSILRQQGLDPISKSGFMSFVENAAGFTGASIGIGEARKRKKRKKVSKADKRRDTSGAVITGAGGAAAATGLVGGGIPGVRANVPHGATEGSRAKKMKATFGSVKGGIFGFRTEAHRNFLHDQEATEAAHSGPASRAEHFTRGRNAGKIGPEKQIIRHMKGGRIGSNVALVGGGAAAAYGVHRMRHPEKVSKAQKDTDRGFGAALGAGGAAAVGSEVGALALEHQGRKWGQRSASSLDEAGKTVPKTGGHTSEGRSVNPRVKDVRPKVNPAKVARDPESFLRGHSSAKAHAAGKLHGAAAQQRHFAGVYGHMANQIRQVRNPAIGVAAVGGGGLLISRHLNKKRPVKKSLTPEEVQREVAVRQTTKGHRFKNKVRYKLGMKPLSKAKIPHRVVTTGGVTGIVSRTGKKSFVWPVKKQPPSTVTKSLVNGKWLQSSKALAAYKQGQKVGGYGKAKGMTPAHAEIKEQTEAGSSWMKSVQQNPQKSHKTLGMLGLHGLAVRTGGKSSGKSTVLLNPQAIARNSGGKRDYRKNLKMVRTHEEAHAQPKRSQYRSHQLNASDAKMGREEGRADYLSQGHHSGYKSPLERSYLDNAPNKEFGAAYRSVQDKMHQAGTKVRKSFPVNHA